MHRTKPALAVRRPAQPPVELQARYVVPFSDVGLNDISRVGGKNASLGEMIQALTPRGIRVPDGFAVTAYAFRLHLKEAGLDSVIYDELDKLDVTDVPALASAAHACSSRPLGLVASRSSTASAGMECQAVTPGGSAPRFTGAIASAARLTI